MASDSPLQISRLLLSAMGVQMYLHHRDRVPPDGATLVVSNHRSFLDAPLLMSAIDRPNSVCLPSLYGSGAHHARSGDKTRLFSVRKL